MSDRWPNKTIPNFTDDELIEAIERHQGDPNATTRDIVRGCWDELARRKGLPTTDLV